ncbi:MAG: aspartyl protease family protein [Candidatus Velthaea sp.]
MRTILIGAVFAASSAVWGASPATAGSDTASIFTKHRAFVGWQADDNSVQTLKLTYAFARRADANTTPAPARQAMPGTAMQWSMATYRRGLLYRNVVTSGRGLTQQDGFNGKQFWDADEGGNSVAVRETPHRIAFTQNVIDAEAAALVSATLRGTAKVGDKTVDIVRIAPGDGVPADLYIDRATGAYLREVIAPDDHFAARSVEIDAYREIAPGKRVVAEEHGTKRGPVVKLLMADLNPALDPADLRPPSPSSSWTFGSQAPYPMTVALGNGGGRSVRVRATINGHEGTFLLDSGSAIDVVFSPFADTIGLEHLGNSGYRGVNGRFVGAKLARAKDLALGANVLHDSIVHISSQTIPGIDGILGYPLLANALVDVDLAAHTLTILDPMKFDANVGKGAFAFPIDLTSRQPGVLLTLPKNVVVRPVLDSGADFFVIVSDELRQSGKVVALASQVTIGGIELGDYRVYFQGADGGAMQSAPCVRLNAINVGPYRYEQAATCFASPDAFGADGGLVGFDFLRHFNWTFDYPEAKLVLTPNGL